ncbi:MAG: NUDIX domain-containing protein [Candidatus Sungbacteria bacterium]|uniref:NUDIX domain-containing protein n=1 Tax=Candidatus Sungiibacteriota bacterium TaxID=2750080 RepID=A0A932YWX4_9BACT|nr:NUDIX domain-containing protein [Candidatus Sungbacteria bacterium]
MGVKAKEQSKFRCVIHGSFRKHFDAIKEAHRVFTAAGIEVLAPKMTDITAYEGGFALLEGEEGKDPRMVELLYLHNLKRLGKGEGGFSYFVNPEGYIGKSASYELGIAQVTNVPCFFLEAPEDHPAYLHKNSVWTPENLATHVMERGELPEPKIKRDERLIHKLWEELMVPGSVVAAGGIITYDNPKARGGEGELLFVRTHKWGDRFSMVGGKVRQHERLSDALKREVKEETGLDGGVDAHICTFDQIKNSGYYLGGVQHIFVDYVFKVGSKRVRLNDEAQDYVWMPAKQALRDLDLEPNARHTVELYQSNVASN